MPEGVDVEEARMLEAAMLGIPYTGRMPDFVNGGGFGGGGFGGGVGGGGGGEPVSPGVQAHRAIREEQDWAYQESLQVLLVVTNLVELKAADLPQETAAVKVHGVVCENMWATGISC